MIRIATVAAAVLGALLILLVLASTMTASNLPVMVHNMNTMDAIPLELRNIIIGRAQAAGIPWPELAAYLKITMEYDFPVPDRMTLVPKGAPLSPTVKEAVEAMWREMAEQWLRDYLEGHGTTDLRSLIPISRLREYDDLVQVLGEAARMRSEDVEAWTELTAGESYQPILNLVEWPHTFPVLGTVSYANDWGQPRPQNEGRAPTRHQGTDVFAPQGRAVRAVCDCLIKSRGWNWLGGWTVTLRDPLIAVDYYYAHLEGYAPGIVEGASITSGTVLGYVGTSGEGPPGTHDRIQQPHLHFGIYTEQGVTNPYPYLVTWN